jgi:hypothetical protein
MLVWTEAASNSEHPFRAFRRYCLSSLQICSSNETTTHYFVSCRHYSGTGSLMFAYLYRLSAGKASTLTLARALLSCFSVARFSLCSKRGSRSYLYEASIVHTTLSLVASLGTSRLANCLPSFTTLTLLLGFLQSPYYIGSNHDSLGNCHGKKLFQNEKDDIECSKDSHCD